MTIMVIRSKILLMKLLNIILNGHCFVGNTRVRMPVDLPVFICIRLFNTFKLGYYLVLRVQVD